jgi:hypothetical protein
MDIQKIRELRLADPFKPFYLVLEDGRKLPVDQPYYLGIAPGDAFLLHSSVGGGFETISPRRVRDVDFRNVVRKRTADRESRRRGT